MSLMNSVPQGKSDWIDSLRGATSKTVSTRFGVLAVTLLLVASLFTATWMARPHATVGVPLHTVMIDPRYAPGVYVVLHYRDEYDVVEGPLDEYMNCDDYLTAMGDTKPGAPAVTQWGHLTCVVKP